MIGAWRKGKANSSTDCYTTISFDYVLSASLPSDSESPQRNGKTSYTYRM